ncbi:MAG: hypothetical protein GF381_00900 [Candidatus Pacebacteria bacterium]|nr:hypothetical protein [Candidatus Paceibacterota bacterium]
MTSFSGSKARQGGQVGVVVLLIMSVLLTLGLSIARQSAQEAEITSQEEQSSRVFNAAESGVEDALTRIHEIEELEEAIENETRTGSLGAGADLSQFQANIQAQDSVEMTIPQNATIEVPLSSPAFSINIDWWFNQTETCTNNGPTALNIIAYDTLAGSTYARHFYAGYCNADGQATPNFIEPTLNSGSSYRFSLDQTQIPLNPGGRTTTHLRITPLISDTQLRVTGQLAVSQYTVTSSGQDVGDNTARTISVNRSRSAAPALMNFALVAGGSGIQKN